LCSSSFGDLSQFPFWFLGGGFSQDKSSENHFFSRTSLFFFGRWFLFPSSGSKTSFEDFSFLFFPERVRGSWFFCPALLATPAQPFLLFLLHSVSLVPFGPFVRCLKQRGPANYGFVACRSFPHPQIPPGPGPLQLGAPPPFPWSIFLSLLRPTGSVDYRNPPQAPLPCWDIILRGSGSLFCSSLTTTRLVL